MEAKARSVFDVTSAAIAISWAVSTFEPAQQAKEEGEIIRALVEAVAGTLLNKADA